MFGMRSSSQGADGETPVQSRWRKTLRLCFIILVAPIAILAGTGCAQKQSPAVAMVKPSDHSQYGSKVPANSYAEVDLEDDGREAQQPPLVTRAPVVDDPTEPYSPNYGRVSSWRDQQQSPAQEYEDIEPVSVRATGMVGFQQSMLR